MMGEARRKRLARELGVSPAVATDSIGLPVSHYEWVRTRNKNMFAFLRKDWERLASGDIDLDAALANSSFATLYASMFLDFLRTVPALKKNLSTEEGLKAARSHLLREYDNVLAYVHSGRKTYFFSAGLTDGLCGTALNCPCDSFQLPLPCVQLVYSNVYAREALASVAERPALEDSVISVYVRVDWFEELGCRRLHIAAYEKVGDDTPSALNRQLALRSDWTLEQALHTEWDDLLGPNRTDVPPMTFETAPDGTVLFTHGGDDKPFFKQGLTFVRMVVNSILYVTSRNAELAERLYPRAIEAPPGAPPPVDSVGSGAGVAERYVHAGEHVEPIPIVIDPRAKHEHGTTLARQGGRYRVRFLIPGFWRRKPNTAESAPKDVWVRPFYKGPEMADLLSRPYVVR